MNVFWSLRARNDLTAIHAYIARDSPLAADRMRERLLDQGEQLSAFPESGRHLREARWRAYRELIEPPYRIIYRITTDMVIVVGVVHSSRVLRPEMLR